MFKDIIDAIISLLDRLEIFNNHKQEKLIAIAKYFEDIAKCLKDIETTSTQNQTVSPADSAKLQTYAANLSQIVGTINSVIADTLTESLDNIINITQNISQNNITDIQKARGQLEAFANIIHIIVTQRRVLPRRAFLLLLSTTAISLTAGWWAGRNQNKTIGPVTIGLLKVTWKMESFLGKNLQNSILYQAPIKISERIKELTNGRFTIELKPTGDTDKNISEYIVNRVNQSNIDIDCGYSGIYYDDVKFRTLSFTSAIPFGLNPQEQTAWLLYKDNINDELTYVQKIYSDKLKLNIMAFPAGGSGAQMGGWFNKEINSIEDFKDLKMRIPGLGADVIEELGGKGDKKIFGKLIPIDEIVTKMKLGEIDAAEWIGPHDDLELRLDEVAKFYYYPGWWEPSTTFDLQVNKNSYDKLPAEYKEILKAVCWETYLKTIAEYDQKNAEALDKIKAKGIQLKEFKPEILDRARQETEKLLELYSSDSNFKEVYQEWKKFKENIKNWSKLNP